MSTHNLGQAKRLASRVAYLEAGRLVVDLPVDRFFNERLPRAGGASSSKENFRGLDRTCASPPPRAGCLAAALGGAAAGPGPGALHRDGIDHLDRAVRPVQGAAAGLQAGHRHRRSRRGRGHRPGAGRGAPRRRRRRVRARHGGRGEVRCRGLRRCKPPAGHVQRLRARRSCLRPGQGQGQRHRGGARQAGRRRRAVHLAWRQERHACGRAAPVEAGRTSTWLASKPAGYASAAAAWARR